MPWYHGRVPDGTCHIKDCNQHVSDTSSSVKQDYGAKCLMTHGWVLEDIMNDSFNYWIREFLHFSLISWFYFQWDWSGMFSLELPILIVIPSKDVQNHGHSTCWKTLRWNVRFRVTYISGCCDSENFRTNLRFRFPKFLCCIVQKMFIPHHGHVHIGSLMHDANWRFNCARFRSSLVCSIRLKVTTWEWKDVFDWTHIYLPEFLYVNITLCTTIWECCPSIPDIPFLKFFTWNIRMACRNIDWFSK